MLSLLFPGIQWLYKARGGLWIIKPCVHRACEGLLASLKVCTKACLELAASVICNLTAQPRTNNSIVSILRGFWGLFSVSWKEVKPNVLGKCGVGEGGPCQVEVAAARPWGGWRNLSKASSLPISCQGKRIFWTVTFHQHLAATSFHFTMFFSTCFKSGISYPT